MLTTNMCCCIYVRCVRRRAHRPEEIDARRDLRKSQIFTIDPPTARDLDDALSWRDLGDGTYEVGVHIADVTYFMKPGTLLDEIAARRATTTYLIQRYVN